VKNEKTPSVSVKIAIENGPFIVDLPSYKMVDLSITMSVTKGHWTYWLV
jgi:hypothetical protein